MKISDLLKMSLASLWRRKVRTILTVMGVVIGTASIVVMISIGVGLNVSVQQSLEEMGDLRIIEVSRGMVFDADGSYSENNDNQMTPEVVETFRQIPNVYAVLGAYQSWGEMTITTAGKQFQGGIVGMDLSVAPQFGYEIHRGEFVDETDGKNVVMVGQLAPFLFMRPNDWSLEWPSPDENGMYPEPEMDILTRRLRISPVNFSSDFSVDKSNSTESDESRISTNQPTEEVITAKGILKANWNLPGAQEGIILGEELYLELLKEHYRINSTPKDQQRLTYDTIRIKVNNISDVRDVETTIKQMGFNTWSMESMREQMQGVYGAVQMVLGGIGAVSMLVAALGIANTMIMSIYERTREIGVMKVLGCKLNDIRLLFLVEAGAIGFVGGMAGLALSYGVSALINSVLGGGLTGVSGAQASVIPLWLALLGLGFSVAVGVIAGIPPANRAVRISALSAIRQD